MMIMKTLNNIRDFFMEYKDGNYFEGDYKDLMFYRYLCNLLLYIHIMLIMYIRVMLITVTFLEFLLRQYQ